jgi:hypothetical protein
MSVDFVNWQLYLFYFGLFFISFLPDTVHVEDCVILADKLVVIVL